MIRYCLLIFCCLFLAAEISFGAVSPDNDGDRVYLKAEQLFLRDNLEGSVKRLDVFFKKHEKDASKQTIAKAINLRGLIYFQLHNHPLSIRQFRKAVELLEQEDEPDTGRSSLHLARYNLANSLFHNKDTELANSELVKVNPAQLDIDTRIRYYHLLGNTLNTLENYPAAVVAFLLTANELDRQDSVATEALVRKAYGIAKNVFGQSVKAEVQKFETFEGKMEDDAIGTWTLRLILAKGYLLIGRRSKGVSLLESFLDGTKKHPLKAEAKRILTLFEKLSIVNTKKIGILLPMTGKYARYGNLSLNSMLLAIGAFDDMADVASQVGAEAQISFVVRDSGITAESAERAFDQLVADDHVIAVIGPLLRRQAAIVAEKSHEYGVPLFNLSQKQSGLVKSSYVFPIALTPQQQIRMTLDYAFETKGFSRFAVLAPLSPVGSEYVRLFWDGVEKRGGVVSAIERYAPRSTDFRHEIKKMIGLYFLDSRRIELEELKKREDKYAATLKVRGKLKKRLLLKFKPRPIVDFDVVFIPDGPNAIGQIAPSFAVHDIKGIPFIGLNTWNTGEVINRAGQYLQQAFFVDTFHSSSRNLTTVNFVGEFQRYFGSTPGTLEVQAFDAANIVISALRSGEVSSRSDLRSHILNKAHYSGISGQFIFSEQGVKRSAHLLGIRGREITEITESDLN